MLILRLTKLIELLIPQIKQELDVFFNKILVAWINAVKCYLYEVFIL